MYLIKIGLFFVAGVLFIAACSQAGPIANAPKNTANLATPAAPPKSPVDAATAGKDLYTVHCMICHRDTGKGGKVTVEGKAMTPEDLTKDKFKTAPDDKLASYVSDGVEDEGMPAFKNKLTEAEIRSVVAHLRTLQK